MHYLYLLFIGIYYGITLSFYFRYRSWFKVYGIGLAILIPFTSLSSMTLTLE